MFIDKIVIEDGGGDFPYSLPAVRAMIEGGGLELDSPVTVFAGENGCGKSTLLEAIAIASGFNAEGGSANMDFSTAESHSPLWRSISFGHGLARRRDGYFLRAETFYNVASYIDELDRQPACSRPIRDSYGGQSLHTRSHGESFMTLLIDRFGGHGLYILDEPESALSPMRQLAMLSRMRDLCADGSQFIIATHSPILMAYPGARIFVLSGDGIKLTPYRETEHYRVTRDFLDDPERMLRYLFSGD